MAAFVLAAVFADGIALAVGGIGYHYLEGLDWLNGKLNAALVLTGNGPVHPPRTPGGKLFTIFYAMLGVILFAAVIGVLLTPVLHRMLHGIHIRHRDNISGRTSNLTDGLSFTGDPAMQPAKLQRYHERLLDERQALVRQRGRVLEAIPEEIHPPGENDVIPSEGIDVEMSLDQGAASRLHEIDAALERVKDGTFGTCSECGCEIPEDRFDRSSRRPQARGDRGVGQKSIKSCPTWLMLLTQGTSDLRRPGRAERRAASGRWRRITGIAPGRSPRPLPPAPAPLLPAD